MSAPWEVLGLAVNCSDQELRATYARLLKQHRPDRDPEGFRRVRDAYEWMREHAAHRELLASLREDVAPPEAEAPASGPETASAAASVPPDLGSATPMESEREKAAPGISAAPPADGPVAPFPFSVSESADLPPPPPPIQTPGPLPVQTPDQPPVQPARRRASLRQRIYHALKEARKKRDRKREEKVLRKLLAVWRAKKTAGDGWDRLLLRSMFRKNSRLLPMLEPEDACLDARRDGRMVAGALIELHARTADWVAVRRILDGLEAHLKSHASAAAADLMLLGAQRIAFLDWRRAQALAHGAFPHLSQAARNSDLGDVDRLIQGGRELGSLNYEDRAQLAHCLALNQADPADEAVHRTFRNISLHGSAITARTYLIQRFPDFTQRLQVKSQTPQAAMASSDSSGNSGGWGGFSYWWIFVLMAVLRLAGSCERTNSSTSTPRPPPKVVPNFQTPEEKWRYMDELNKKLDKKLPPKTLKPPEKAPAVRNTEKAAN